MNKRLLVDYIPLEVNPQIINESIEKNNGKVIIQGVLQRANTKNQNGRVYSKNILEREINKYMQLIKERRSLGELDHPDSSIINLSNVSHVITEAHWKGNDLVGSLEVLNTPSGNILRELLKSDVKIGVSSRGLGSIRESTNGDEVQDDYELICWDCVSNPSVHGAFMNKLYENVNKNTKYDRINEIIMEILLNNK